MGEPLSDTTKHALTYHNVLNPPSLAAFVKGGRACRSTVQHNTPRPACLCPPPTGVTDARGVRLCSALAYYTDWPTSFWITALSGMVF